MLEKVESGDALEKNTCPGDKNSPRNSHPQTPKTTVVPTGQTMVEVCAQAPESKDPRKWSNRWDVDVKRDSQPEKPEHPEFQTSFIRLVKHSWNCKMTHLDFNAEALILYESFSCSRSVREMHDDSQRSKSITTNIFVAPRTICDHRIQCRFNTSCKGHLDDILQEQKRLVKQMSQMSSFEALFTADDIIVDNIVNRFLPWFWYTLGCILLHLVIAEYVTNIAAFSYPFQIARSHLATLSKALRLPPNFNLNHLKSQFSHNHQVPRSLQKWP